MSTEVLVTVVGSARRGDVCLDNSVPIAALVADLVRHYGSPHAGGDLVLANDSGALLDPDASLAEAGVTHGARLTLRPRPQGPQPTRVKGRPGRPAGPAGGRRGHASGSGGS